MSFLVHELNSLDGVTGCEDTSQTWRNGNKLFALFQDDTAASFFRFLDRSTASVAGNEPYFELQHSTAAMSIILVCVLGGLVFFVIENEGECKA
jgi:hypothetical protein